MVLALHIGSNSEIPLYRRLAAALIDAIHSRRLRDGEELPSAKELASSLAISRATVVKSYNLLISQGYLAAVTGSGTFVRGQNAEVKQSKNDQSCRSANASIKSLTAISSYAKRLLETEIVKSTSGDLPDLNFGAPPAVLLPQSKWREVLLKHCKTREPNASDYATETFGLRPLREAIASFLGRLKGVECSADQIIVFDGSQNALAHIVRLLVEPGDLAVVENPGYTGARENLAAAGAQLFACDIDDEGMQIAPLDSLDRRAKLCYVTSSHHDPTGVTMSLSRRQELISWSQDNCDYIIEDNWDSDYYYGAAPVPALQSMGDEERVLFIYSFWKLLFPLVTIGVLVVPRHLIGLFERSKLLTERHFPVLEHYALADMIEDGSIDLHVKRTAKIYKARRQSLLFSLTQEFQTQVAIPRHSAGLHTSVSFNIQGNEKHILSSAQASGLPIVSTKRYYHHNPRAMEFLIPFATIEEESIAAIVKCFAENIRAAVGISK